MTAKRQKARGKTRAPQPGETAPPPRTTASPASPPAERGPNVLVNKLKAGQLPIDATAQLAVAGLASNAVATQEWSCYSFGQVDLTACLNEIVDSAERANRNDLGDGEAMLMAQAITLNAMFAQLARLALKTDHVPKFDLYMRFGLRAQNQCRATLETLAAIKNPPTVFAKQANIANAPQH